MNDSQSLVEESDDVIDARDRTRRGSAPDATSSVGQFGRRLGVGARNVPWFNKFTASSSKTHKKKKKKTGAGLHERVEMLSDVERPRAYSVDLGIGFVIDRHFGSLNMNTPPNSSENIIDEVDQEVDTISRSRKSQLQPKATNIHTATARDTLSSVAAQYRTTTSELTRINRLMSNMIFPGQKLFVPGEDYVPTGYHSLSASPRPPQTHTGRTTTTTTTATLVDIEFTDDSKKTKKSTFLQEPPSSDKQSRRSSDSSQTNSQNALNITTTTTTTTFLTVNVEYIADITTMCLVAGNLSVFDNEIKFEPDTTTLTKQQLDDVDKYQLAFTRTSINVNILDSLPTTSDLTINVQVSSNDSNQPGPVTVNTNNDSNHDSCSIQDTCQDSGSQEREQDTVPDSTQGSNVGDNLTCIRPTFRIGCDTTQEQHEEDRQTDNTTTSDGIRTACPSDVKYLCIKFGIPSKAAQDRPTISCLVKSFLPTVDWIEHYFVLRNESFDELSAVISRLFPADEADETLDTVPSDIAHSKQRTKPVYRRTLSAAELYNLPLPELSHSSNILTETHIRTLREHLPPRADGRSWLLMYSTSRDGCSINTMYRRLEGVDSPVLLIVRDNNSRVFGAVLSCEPRVSESFYGNGEIFLFTFYPTFKKYSWTGDNNYFIKGNTDSLIIGSGDAAFGLWLDDSLYRGRTQHCDTFHNEPLTADNEDFTVQCLETWSFPWSF